MTASSYCSLVDKRWRDFIHWMVVASVYRMDRPIRM
jgi:hypothetical protein